MKFVYLFLAIFLIGLIFVLLAKNSQLEEEVVQEKCGFDSKNFQTIIENLENSEISFADWQLFSKEDGSLSFVKAGEEIFVVYDRGESLDFIPLAKKGYTSSIEEQHELFCRALK